MKLLRPKKVIKVLHIDEDRPEMVGEDGLLSGKRLRDHSDYTSSSHHSAFCFEDKGKTPR